MGRLSVLQKLGPVEGEFEEATPWWFETEQARVFVENETDWDGSNNVSRTTGDAFASESLFVTANCRYALYYTSSYQGRPDRVTELDVKQVVDWLIKNGTDPQDHPKMPSEVVDEYRSRQG